jgi:hypothetical protein
VDVHWTCSSENITWENPCPTQSLFVTHTCFSLSYFSFSTALEADFSQLGGFSFCLSFSYYNRVLQLQPSHASLVHAISVSSNRNSFTAVIVTVRGEVSKQSNRCLLFGLSWVPTTTETATTEKSDSHVCTCKISSEIVCNCKYS